MINKMNGKSVCWNITSRCNENCQFCYRIICNKESTYEQNKKILKTLIELKTEKITWTGGECLLYPHLFKLMKEAHGNHIKNNIITNGRNLNENIINEIKEYTDYITFSIDTLNDNINNELGRGIEHTNHIIKLINYIQNNNIDIKIKLNSIVTKFNIEYIEDIVEIIKKYKIERWKLFKFISLRGKSIENRNKFEIGNEEYDELIKRLKDYDLNCPVISCKEEQIEEYLLINPIGEFLVTSNGKDKLVCDSENIRNEKIEEIFLNEFR